MTTTPGRAVAQLRHDLAVLRNALVALVALSDVTTSHTPRTATVDLAGLAANSTTTKTATWSVPVPSDYRVVIQPVIAAARLGTIFATIAAGTKGATTVDILVVNASGTPLVAGSLDVVIHPA
jgi:hypothetical protein